MVKCVFSIKVDMISKYFWCDGMTFHPWDGRSTFNIEIILGNRNPVKLTVISESVDKCVEVLNAQLEDGLFECDNSTIVIDKKLVKSTC